MRQHSGALERKRNRQFTRPFFPAGAREKCGLGTRLECMWRLLLVWLLCQTSSRRLLGSQIMTLLRDLKYYIMLIWNLNNDRLPACKIENVVTINCEFSLPRLTGTCGLYIVHCHSQTTFISYKFLVADNRSSTATLSYKSRFNSSVVKFAPTYWLATLQRIPYVHSVLKATALI